MKKLSILSLHLNYGGAEKSICALANLLCDKYDVEIVCTYKIIDKPAFYLDPKIKVKYLTDVKPNENEWKKTIKEKNIFKFIKESFYSVKVLYLRKKTMKEYIKNTDTKIIISSRYLFNNILSKYSKKDVLKIGWEHNHPHGNMKFANKVTNSAKGLDYFVLVSKNLQSLYKEKLKKSKCKYVYIPNIVDENDKSSDLLSKNLVSVGRLSKEKGFMDLLIIFNKILKKYPDYKLNIIGDGEEKEKLENYIKENHLEKNVIMHGFQNKDYINNVLLGSMIYLMTSFTESFGIVLIEAMSYGIPCIAFSSAEGAEELIENGKNGYLIDDRNIDKYVSKVEFLMNNFEERKKMQNNCINKANEFLGKNVIKKWLEILKGV